MQIQKSNEFQKKTLKDDKEIIYMDETSTNVWESKYKMWQPNN